MSNITTYQLVMLSYQTEEAKREVVCMVRSSDLQMTKDDFSSPISSVYWKNNLRVAAGLPMKQM